MSWRNDIRVVIGLDFGTTYSGFSFCHVEEDEEIIGTNDQWPGGMGHLKTNTVLQYDAKFETVKSWGNPALYEKPSKKDKNKERATPVELFKLYLGNCLEAQRPKLPVPFKKAIKDYLHEIGKLIKETIAKKWSGIDFMENVLLVLTIPAEYSEIDKAIMRECSFEAGLITNKFSEKLQFTTEPEAAAIYCMRNSLREHELTDPGTTFMIVDCGGGTVDLTTRKLLEDNQLGEVTERAGDFCGSTFVDKKFISLLEREVGDSAFDLLRENHYGQMQYMVQEFCQNVKLKFTGDDPNFSHEIDLEDVAPSLLQYVTGPIKDSMEEKEWVIELNFRTIKSMFDPIVDRIIEMIRAQLDNSSGKCSAIFLVGGFSQSKYLQKRIKAEFNQLVENISIPPQPVAAIVRGAAMYGRSLQESTNLKDMSDRKCIIATRVLRHTFGIKVVPDWEPGDPLERLLPNGGIEKFLCIVKRQTEVTVDKEITVSDLVPIYQFQTKMSFNVFYTTERGAKYCDEPGMKLLGKLKIDLPDVELGVYRSVTFGLSFGSMEIRASAFNEINGQNYQATFELSDM